MPSYSIDFLSNDWDGAGFDFSFAAIFAPDNINAESIRAFLTALAQYAKISIKWAPDAVAEGYGAFGTGHVAGRATKLMASGMAPNVSDPLCNEIKADIMFKCREIREAANR